MSVIARPGLKLPPLTELPTLIFDFLISWNIPRLTRFILMLYGQPRGWLGRLVGRVMSFEHGPITRWVLDLMQLQPQDRVLDVGCGSGMAVEQMALRASRGLVAGLDHSEVMVAQATARNRVRVRSGHVQLHRADACCMPFADASFDKVLSIETLYFWPEPRAVFDELYRILAPGGRLAIAMEYTKDTSRAAAVEASFDPSLKIRLYSTSDVLELFAAAGFTELRWETEPTRSNGWMYVEGTRPVSPCMDRTLETAPQSGSASGRGCMAAHRLQRCSRAKRCPGSITGGRSSRNSRASPFHSGNA